MLPRQCSAVLARSQQRLNPTRYAARRSPLSRATNIFGLRSVKAYSTKAKQDHIFFQGTALPHVQNLPGAKYGPIHPGFLRDACRCVQCVDPSTRQKNFQTSDIPINIKATNIEVQGDNVLVKWENDLPGYEEDHVSSFSTASIKSLAKPSGFPKIHFPLTWDNKTISAKLQCFDYTDYQENDLTLLRALMQLHTYGLILVRNTPESELSVEKIANRIGNLKETLYGRTWDVRSIPNAKNVAYTSKNLGLHMDLLYTDMPPELQLLHCLKNSCQGGLSVFADGFQAATELSGGALRILSKAEIPYHYENDGQNYSRARRVIQFNKYDSSIYRIHWSPPFQGQFLHVGPKYQAFTWPRVLRALKDFGARIEAPENVYKYQLQEGDCVIFKNRRVLHGRTAFDTATGERWLKGAYIDNEVLRSKTHVLLKQFGYTLDTVHSKANLDEHATYVHSHV